MNAPFTRAADRARRIVAAETRTWTLSATEEALSLTTANPVFTRDYRAESAEPLVRMALTYKDPMGSTAVLILSIRMDELRELIAGRVYRFDESSWELVPGGAVRILRWGPGGEIRLELKDADGLGAVHY